MKIGIGIDTGGTCTDAVVYQFEKKEILAYAKTLTTKEDLSQGIGKALDKLPKELVDQAEVIALSTTLATNACVENKGGRAKLVLFGIEPSTIAQVGEDYGLPMDETLYYVDSKTKPTGKIVRKPDWDEFSEKIHQKFDECDSVGLVEMFAKKSGAQLEKKARALLKEELDIPIICGHELFTENNIVKRGASALLNARLIPVIQEFLGAVKKALEERKIKVPFVIVRSDGSLMTEKFTATRPVETLLCGPVASVMGAVELTDEKNCMIVDIGGTTTDIAFVKDGNPQCVTSGVRIGKWSTFVKGLFVDTFGLGGDSGIRVEEDQGIIVEEEKVMPLCIAARKYPKLLTHLKRENEIAAKVNNFQKDIYLAVKDICYHNTYTDYEKTIGAALYQNPMSLEKLSETIGEFVIPAHVERLIREGIIIRCGVTPTDVMHMKGDFNQYDAEASALGISIMSRYLSVTPEELGDMIYDAVKKKLYFNIVRILIEDAYPRIRQIGLGEQLTLLIEDSYERAKTGEPNVFFGMNITTPAVLIGVGAPTHIFLKDVGRLLGTEVRTSEYSKVANALGAVVGNVSASVSMEVTYNQDMNVYTVFGAGVRQNFDNLEDAKELADKLAGEKALEEAINRGSDENAAVTLEVKEDIVETEFGAVYMGYKVVATATGNLKLS